MFYIIKTQRLLPSPQAFMVYQAWNKILYAASLFVDPDFFKVPHMFSPSVHIWTFLIPLSPFNLFMCVKCSPLKPEEPIVDFKLGFQVPNSNS
jgi:hypothetical protein